MGCGALWWDVVEKMGHKWEKNERKMGGKWDEILIFQSPIFRRSKIFPTVPFVKKKSSTHSPTEKWEFWPLNDTHRHGGSCRCLHNITR